MTTYIGTWGANSSSYDTINGDNFRELKARLCAIVKGNTIPGHNGGWTITTDDGSWVAASNFRANRFPQWVKREEHS